MHQVVKKRLLVTKLSKALVYSEHEGRPNDLSVLR